MHARTPSRVQEESVAAGMTEPASLHPLIDPSKCLGCGACVKACPEQPHHEVLGLIDGKAVLVGPTDCIGHGACKTVCPFDAITLVFGTERRGLDIPVLKPNFESNVPGIYVAGELGGMGLIKNALTQGQQALEAIAKAGVKRPGALDVLIVGAGPAGLAASLAAKKLGLNYQTVEQDSLGGAVFQYPRGKLVMTAPVELPIVGKVQFRNTSKEDAAEILDRCLQGQWPEDPLPGARRERSKTRTACFTCAPARSSTSASAVLLAIGRRGTPRKLGVPGEELPKVVYRLIDPEQYRGQQGHRRRRRRQRARGGGQHRRTRRHLGDPLLPRRGLSARQAAQSPARRGGERQGASSRCCSIPRSSEIRPDEVLLKQAGQEMKVSNDAVIVSAGGILPNDFLRSIGIEVETKYGTA